ncbi:MAG: hypothetical protein BWK79_19600 [Beggiatoa sp. IS2]|nr:MAG: hypothetical protein BWK79_19600 [Beggiatoa sp. IS2]
MKKMKARLSYVLTIGCVLYLFVTTEGVATNSSAQLPVSSGTPEVVMWSTPSCVYCKKARTYFKAKKFTWREINVSGQGIGVPVIFVCDRRMDGWNPQRFERLLAQCR